MKLKYLSEIVRIGLSLLVLSFVVSYLEVPWKEDRSPAFLLFRRWLRSPPKSANAHGLLCPRGMGDRVARVFRGPRTR